MKGNNMEKITEAEYLQAIVRPLLVNDLHITKTVDERGVLLTMDLETEDIGRVIGRKGETARAIRRLVRQFGMAHEQHIAVRINEPEPKKQDDATNDGDFLSGTGREI